MGCDGEVSFRKKTKKKKENEKLASLNSFSGFVLLFSLYQKSTFPRYVYFFTDRNTNIRNSFVCMQSYEYEAEKRNFFFFFFLKLS